MSALAEIVTFEPGDRIRSEACVPAMRLPFAAQDVDSVGRAHARLRANVMPRYAHSQLAGFASRGLQICRTLRQAMQQGLQTLM